MCPGVATISHGCVSQSQFHPLRSHGDVARGTPPAAVAGRCSVDSQSGGAHHDLGAVALLQFRGALIMISVRMTDDDILDVARLETEFRHTVDDLRFRGPGEIGIDEDDSCARLKRPGRMLARTQPVKVVEHLDGRRIPVARSGV